MTWTQEETSLVVREIENCLGKRSISKANHLFRFLPGEKQKEFVEAFRLRNHENIHESLKWNVGNSMQALSFYERIKPVEKLKERTDLEDLTKEEKTFRETRRTFVTQPKQFNGLSRRTKYVRPIFLATVL